MKKPSLIVTDGEMTQDISETDLPQLHTVFIPKFDFLVKMVSWIMPDTEFVGLGK